MSRRVKKINVFIAKTIIYFNDIELLKNHWSFNRIGYLKQPYKNRNYAYVHLVYICNIMYQ